MPTTKDVNRAYFIAGLLLFISLITPFHFHPYRNFFNDALAILAVLLGLGYLSSCSGMLLKIPSAIVVPIGMIIVILLQTLNGFILYPIDSLFPVLYLICLVFAMVFGASLRANNGNLTNLVLNLSHLFVAVGLLSVFFEHVQLINLNWYPYIMPLAQDHNLRPFANLAQPNLLALVLCFSVASVWWLYLIGRIKPWLAIGIIVTLLWGIALTQSRICWIILPLYTLLCWHQPPNHAKVSKAALLFLMLLFAVMVIFSPDILAILGVGMDSAAQRAGHTSARVVLWQQAWEMSKSHPWFGVGWYQFGEYQVIVSTLFKPTEYSEYAHNMVLSFGAELGWPCTLIILSSAAYWFYRCCIQCSGNIEVRWGSLIIIAAMVHCMVEFPIWNGFILMPFGVIVGALHVEQLGWKNIAAIKGWGVTFCISSVLLVAGLSWDYVRVMNGFDALMWQQQGQKTGMGSTDKPDYTAYSQFYDYFHIVKIKIFPGMPKEDLQFLERASLRFAFPPVLKRLVLAYAYNQRWPEAQQVLLTMERLQGPTYPETYTWMESLAHQYPVYFSEIFKRMSKPVVNETPKSVVVVPNVKLASPTAS